jgi:hypothetical protein
MKNEKIITLRFRSHFEIDPNNDWVAISPTLSNGLFSLVRYELLAGAPGTEEAGEEGEGGGQEQQRRECGGETLHR